MSTTFPRHLVSSLDLAAFDALCRSAEEQGDQTLEGDHKLKHTDLDRWIARAWKEARHLKLDRSPPLDILDIGLGPGYFVYACQQLGHRCVGLDRPGFFPLWHGIQNWLGIGRVVEYTIKPNEKMPADLGRFDVVTAYRCQFNYNPVEKRLWNLDEWDFFLDDLRDNVLKPGGRFVLRLTKQKDKGKAGLRRDDALLVKLLAERGARKSGRILVFAPLLQRRPRQGRAPIGRPRILPQRLGKPLGRLLKSLRRVRRKAEKRLARLPVSLRERLGRLRHHGKQDLSSIDRASARLRHLPRPDFLIIGAPKCGTSWLQRALAQHPDIVTVPDEIEYFSSHLDLPLEWYLNHFTRELAGMDRQAGTRRVIGEKSARYCSIDPERIRLVHRLLPEAKIILMTRDPVARHWSHAKRFFSKRRFNRREGGVLAVPREELFTFFERMRPLSEFSTIIGNWTSIYEPRQLLIISQEAALARPREAYDATLEHIGASRKYNPAKIKLLRAETNLGPKVEMPDDVRAHLEAMFAVERERLRALLGDRTAVYVER